MYSITGRKLILVAGLLHIIFSIGSVGVAVVEISAISYSDIHLMSLPDALPRISWMGHYWLVLIISLCNFAIGFIALKYRLNFDKTKLLLMVSVAGIAIYTAFVVFSGYDEAYYRNTLWVFPAAFAVQILYFIGALSNFIAYKKYNMN